jgi:hypothetical protein
MKKLLALTFAAIISITPAMAHEDHGKSQFGGVVAEGGDYQAELVASSERLTLHISDHGNPVPTAGGAAKLTLLVSGRKSEVILRPAGNNRFEAAGSFNVQGAKIVAALNVPGKPAKTLRFALDGAQAAQTTHTTHTGH